MLYPNGVIYQFFRFPLFKYVRRFTFLINCLRCDHIYFYLSDLVLGLGRIFVLDLDDKNFAIGNKFGNSENASCYWN